MTTHEHEAITLSPVIKVLTAVADDDPEYREYYVPSDDPPQVLEEVDDPDIQNELSPYPGASMRK
ncbi:MAG: hypothetical protein SVG88_07045 [Halobacteriales archaeon]|nr:hypothetical protein [Halobacteriales archaeon]